MCRHLSYLNLSEHFSPFFDKKLVRSIFIYYRPDVASKGIGGDHLPVVFDAYGIPRYWYKMPKFGTSTTSDVINPYKFRDMKFVVFFM